MSELDLDKIEKTYPSFTGKKYDLDSVRISTGRMRPGYSRIIRRDLSKDARKTHRVTDTL